MSVLSFIGLGAASAVIGSLFYANLPTRYTIGAVVPTAKYLSEATLKKIEPGAAEQSVLAGKALKAASIFDEHPAVLVMAVRRPGCAFCRQQASELVSIADKLKQHRVYLMGVLHETKGSEGFRPFLANSDLYYDEGKTFYGPEHRWLPMWMGALRLGTYINAYKTKRAGVEGNLEGEGRLLGGIYLIKKDQMIFSHLEREWGDRVDIGELEKALQTLDQK